MLSRLEKYKQKQKRKKILLLLGAVVLTLSIGSGVKTTFADADISTLLTNWFKNQEAQSINEIDEAITAEKTVLLAQLKSELKTEMDTAKNELDAFTEKEKADRIASLRQYAADLIANLSIDNSEEKNAVTANINSIVENAIAQMNGAVASVPEAAPVVEPAPEEEAPPVPEPTPGSESDTIPIQEPVPVIAPPAPVPEPTPIAEPVLANPEPVSEPITEPKTDPVLPNPNPVSEPVNSPSSDSTSALDDVNVQANREEIVENE